MLDDNVSDTTQPHAGSDRYVNDPAIAALLADAEADRRKMEMIDDSFTRLTKASLDYHLRQAERLTQILEGGITGPRFAAYALQMTGFADQSARELARLHSKRDEIRRLTEAAAEKARIKGKAYKYPSWRAAWAMVNPPPPKKERRPATPDVDLASEVPVASDLNREIQMAFAEEAREKAEAKAHAAEAARQETENQARRAMGRLGAMLRPDLDDLRQRWTRACARELASRREDDLPPPPSELQKVLNREHANLVCLLDRRIRAEQKPDLDVMFGLKPAEPAPPPAEPEPAEPAPSTALVSVSEPKPKPNSKPNPKSPKPTARRLEALRLVREMEAAEKPIKERLRYRWSVITSGVKKDLKTTGLVATDPKAPLGSSYRLTPAGHQMLDEAE